MAMAVRYLTVEGEVLSETRGGVTRDYLSDSLGNTLALLDSSQNKTDSFSYWPYGEERTSFVSTGTPFRYVGALGYYADNASRSYVRRRVMRKDLGRWMSVDFLWPDENAYVYVAANPVSYNDPSGMQILPFPGTGPFPNILPPPCTMWGRECGMGFSKQCRRTCRRKNDWPALCHVIEWQCVTLCFVFGGRTLICLCAGDIKKGLCFAFCSALCAYMPFPIGNSCKQTCMTACDAWLAPPKRLPRG